MFRRRCPEMPVTLNFFAASSPKRLSLMCLMELTVAARVGLGFGLVGGQGQAEMRSHACSPRRTNLPDPRSAARRWPSMRPCLEFE